MPETSGETIGGPSRASWQEGALTRAAELEVLAEWFLRPTDQPTMLADQLRRHLKSAREAAEHKAPRGWFARPFAFLTGSAHERAAANLDAAEVNVLRLADDEYLRGQLPSLLAHVRGHLRAEDPRRIRMEALVAELPPDRPLGAVERNLLASATRAAQSEARREIIRVRSFRNVLLLAAAILTFAVAGLTALALLRADAVPLCFAPAPPDRVVCATGERVVGTDSADAAMRRAASPWDVVTVEVLGLIAAAVASAVALRGIRGTATPYSLPVALALLKLPTGALTAVLGLLLMRGDFVPGLSALDSSGQILAWAIVFGYAQQAFTRFVDQQAHTVLDQVGARGSGPAPVGEAAVLGALPAVTWGEPGAGPNGRAARGPAEVANGSGAAP